MDYVRVYEKRHVYILGEYAGASVGSLLRYFRNAAINEKGMITV